MLTRSGMRTRRHAHADPGGQLLRRNDYGDALTDAGRSRITSRGGAMPAVSL